jgi:hypothetical protein
MTSWMWFAPRRKREHANLRMIRPNANPSIRVLWLLVCHGTDRHDAAQPGIGIGGVAHEPA